MNISENDFRKVEDLEDGSSVYEIVPKSDFQEEEEEYNNFGDNLAVNYLEDQALKNLSSFLIEAIDQDIEARKDWITPVDKAKEFLGFSLEDLDGASFKQATRTFDTTLSTALIRFYAVTRAELLPPNGPAGFKINGAEDEYLTAKGEKIRDWLNYYLTVVDEAYYQDCERFLLYLGLYGSIFKKVYYDPILQKPLSRFISPENFVVDSDCTSILESNRLTHILHLSKREILLNQQNGIYRDVNLNYLKKGEVEDDEEGDDKESNKAENGDITAYKQRSLFPVYEVHTYLNLEEFQETFESSGSENQVPLPYIVVIDKTSKEILSIRRNWEESDPLKQKINFFVQYNYLPGFGIYGLGLAHLIGSNAITLTKLLRQLVDAGTFKNFPGGLRVKGFKEQANDLIVGPGEFPEVDTGGIPLKEAFMPLPYSEPSQVLRELLLQITASTEKLGSTSEMGMLDSKEDIATGTAIAFLETNNRIQSSVLRSIHYSLTRELQLLQRLFSTTLESEEFYASNQTQQINRDDFVDFVKIIPVSDPATNSTVQRIMRAESILQTAQQDPSIHNMPNIFKMVYKAQGLSDEEIESVLVQKEQEAMPLDPISENANMLLGKPAVAASWQEHASHKLVHGLFAEEYPDLKPVILAHIREHEALEYLIQMQQKIGFELPPLEQIQDPQIQNAIALATAESIEESGAQQEQQAAEPLDPNMVLMADIQQQAAETESKERIANLKAETDIFKAQLDFEKEKAKLESDKEIAELRADTDLEKIDSNEDIAQLKAETDLAKQEMTNERY